MEQTELVDVNLIIFDKSKNRPAPIIGWEIMTAMSEKQMFCV
jgi:hypothetical protein